MAAGDYHHHLAINTWESLGGQPPAPGTTGLYHTAILYPTRRLLADALRRVIEAKIPLDGASDHGVSEALYLRDPDENGVELYRDRPREQWKCDANGDVVMKTEPLDLRDLLAELEKAPLKRNPAKWNRFAARLRDNVTASPHPRPRGAPARRSDARDIPRRHGYRC